MNPLSVPMTVLSDSYKATHFKLYPEAVKMVAYGEFRQSYDKDYHDSRILFYGIRYVVENYIAKRWTLADLEMADKFYKTHNAGFSALPYPRELFRKFIVENDGYFPVKIESLPEGSVIYPHVPVFQITAVNEYSSLCTWLETLLTMIWRDKSRLHDFGFRGCTSVEQSIIGGAAHLLNFEGSDTMSAAFYVQFHLNNGKPVATSIPATEHSVMTSWNSEKEAMLNLMKEYGSSIYACVMDSYDYASALEDLLPVVASKKLEKGGFLVVRPDSGDPVETVLMGLKYDTYLLADSSFRRALDKVFGSIVNTKGFKVLRGCSVIQGDGINILVMQKIMDEVLKLGFSAQNVSFGMGGGLLQKVNRDTMSFATKLSLIQFKDGSVKDIMKIPKTDSKKISLPGEMKVVCDSDGIARVFPSSSEGKNFMVTVYDNGKLCEWDDFETIKTRVRQSWERLPKKTDVISQALQEKIASTVANISFHH